MFQPSTGSSSCTNELNYQNDFPQFQKLIKHLNNLKLIKSKSNIKNIIISNLVIPVSVKTMYLIITFFLSLFVQTSLKVH